MNPSPLTRIVNQTSPFVAAAYNPDPVVHDAPAPVDADISTELARAEELLRSVGKRCFAIAASISVAAGLSGCVINEIGVGYNASTQSTEIRLGVGKEVVRGK